MNSRKYQQKKNNIISEIKTIFSSYVLSNSNIIVDSIEFEEGRDSDNFIIAKLLNKETKTVAEIIFCINFWINFDFEKDINIIILKRYNKLYRILKYDKIEGSDFTSKMYSLLKNFYE